MKTFIIPALIALATAGSSAYGIAATDHDSHGGHGAMHASVAAETPLVEGLVKKVDKPAAKARGLSAGFGK